MPTDGTTTMRSQTYDLAPEMSPDERLATLAAIFADALIRLKQRRILACPNPENTSREGLEVSPDTVLSVIHGGLLPRPFGDRT